MNKEIKLTDKKIGIKKKRYCVSMMIDDVCVMEWQAVIDDIERYTKSFVERFISVKNIFDSDIDFGLAFTEIDKYDSDKDIHF